MDRVRRYIRVDSSFERYAISLDIPESRTVLDGAAIVKAGSRAVVLWRSCGHRRRRRTRHRSNMLFPMKSVKIWK